MLSQLQFQRVLRLKKLYGACAKTVRLYLIYSTVKLSVFREPLSAKKKYVGHAIRKYESNGSSAKVTPEGRSRQLCMGPTVFILKSPAEK